MPRRAVRVAHAVGRDGVGVAPPHLVGRVSPEQRVGVGNDRRGAGVRNGQPPARRVVAVAAHLALESRTERGLLLVAELVVRSTLVGACPVVEEPDVLVVAPVGRSVRGGVPAVPTDAAAPLPAYRPPHVLPVANVLRGEQHAP